MAAFFRFAQRWSFEIAKRSGIPPRQNLKRLPILNDAVFRCDAAPLRAWIQNRITANNRSGIQNRVAADLRILADPRGPLHHRALLDDRAGSDKHRATDEWFSDQPSLHGRLESEL